MWLDKSFEKLKDFHKKYSLVLQEEDRNLVLDAFIQLAGLYATLEKMEERNYPIELEQIKKRIEWSFEQLFLKYRNKYPEIEGSTDDRGRRFFWISPMGEVKINRRVYNIPKRHSEVGFVPSLLLNAWVLRRYPEEWNKASKQQEKKSIP